MKKKGLKILLVLLLSFGLTSISLAQRQTGTITGKLTDEEGISLPGASVTLSGPSIMGTLYYTTAVTGDFRFPAVPPGRDYTLTVELSGFKTLTRVELIVNVGRTTRVVIEMELTTLKEEITVTAPSPTVDVTSTKQAVTYTTDMIERMPIARDYREIIRTAPGTVGDSTGPRPHGSGYRTSLVQVDGASITDRALGSQGFQLPFDMLDEVEMEFGGHMAEVGMTEGAYVNIVTKSGGNEFHGSALAYFYNEDMARNLIPESEVEAVGLSSPTGVKSLYDVSATLGGPIIKDRLWFFTNARLSGNKYREDTLQDGEFDRPEDDKWGFLKLTAQVTSNLKLTAMGSLRYYDNPLGYFSLSYYREKLSGRNQMGAKDYVGTGIINWVLSQNTFVDVRFGGQGIFYPRYFNPDYSLPPTDQAQILQDRGDVPLRIGPCRWNDQLNRFQLQGNASITHFMDNVLGGNHELKAGLEWEKAWVDNPIWTPYPIQQQWTYNGLPWGYHDAVPYMGRIRSMVVGDEKENWNLRVYMNRWAAYFQDSFTIKDRLTLNLGLRYNHSSGYTKAQKLYPVGRLSPVLKMLAPTLFQEVDFHAQDDMIVWTNFSPRVGLAYDLFGDGTTSIKTSWSRYAMFLVMEYYISLSPAMPHRPFEAYWFDLDKDGLIETTDDYQIISQPPDIADFDWRNLAAEDLKVPYTDEFIVGVEREVVEDFRVSASYIHKMWHGTFDDVEVNRGYTLDDLTWYVPYKITEPGEDGNFGTSDDQQITVYGVKEGAPPSWRIMDNPEGFKKSYHGVEFVFNKRMSKGWQLLGSVTLSKTEGNFDSGSGSGFTSAFDSPNWYINREGRLSYDTPVIIKLQGSVNLPLGFMLSGYYSYLSGTPFARTLQIQLPNDPATFEYPGTFVSVNAEAPGERRYKSETNLDLRIEKMFNIGDFGRFGVFVDILNAFGDRGYSIAQDPGGRVYNNGTFKRHSTYGRFSRAYGFRTYKVSARFTF